MKKSFYIIIITLITLVCIVVGCVRFAFNIGQNVLDYFTGSTEETTSDVTTKNSQTLDEFTSIELDVNVLDVTVMTGDSYSIAYDCSEKLKPTYEVKDGVLVVKQTGKNWNAFSFANSNCEATITIPADVELDSLDITSDVGDIDISDITVKTTIINADVGDATIKKSSLGNAEFSLDTGDVEIENSDFDTLSIKADVGDVEIDSAVDLSEYNMDLSTSVGNIEVNNENYDEKYYSWDTNTKNSLTIDNSTGDIDITY